MAIRWGDTGKVVIGTYKSINITVTPNETVLGTTVQLPTSNPANGQFSYTISSYLPTITPSFYSCSYLPMIYAGGQNTTASAITIYWEVDKNGTSVGSGSTSIPANNYWTLNFNTDICTNIGDVYAVKLYGSATGLTLTYQSIIVYPVRMLLSKFDTVLRDVSCSIATPSLTASANNAVANTGYWYVYFDNANAIQLSTNTTFYAYKPGNTTYNIGTTQMGEIGFKNQILTAATQMPRYNVNRYISQISFREVLR